MTIVWVRSLLLLEVLKNRSPVAFSLFFTKSEASQTCFPLRTGSCSVPVVVS